jgi:hypothetical protein
MIGGIQDFFSPSRRQLQDAMTPTDIGIAMLSTGACLAVIRLAVQANRDWPAFYRIFLLLFFTVWSAIVWLQPRTSSAGRLIPALALLAGALAVGFIPFSPPKNRHQTKNLLDLIETERTLEQFFNYENGRLFWPLLAVLVFLVALRLWMPV